MRDIIESVEAWASSGKRFGLAVVTRTWGSSPRPAGSWMAVCEDGALVGSVSGGCVEAAVAEAVIKATRTGDFEWLNFEGLDSDEFWRVGLPCGGRIRVLALPEPERSFWKEAVRRIRRDEPFVVVTDGHRCGLYPEERFKFGAKGAALAKKALTARATLEDDGMAAIAQVPRPTLLIVGAVHITATLVDLAGLLGYRTEIIEPRSRLAETFAGKPDRLICGWPQEALDPVKLDSNTFAVALTHDPKIDDPALKLLIRSKVAYVGALGSSATHANRRDRLLAEGFSEAEVNRIRGPVGLSIGAQTPSEIALSILAEIVQVRRESI